MTFTINATVTKVTLPIPGSDDDGNTHVRLEATAGEEVTNHGQAMQAIYSNTEGVIVQAKVALIIEGSEPPLAKGDVVSFTGHFTAPKPPPA